MKRRMYYAVRRGYSPANEVLLEVIRDRRPALLITDIMMPLMTGLELARAVRADGMIADIPIILVSGAQGSIGRAHPEAFDAVLDKPYELKDMLKTVDRLLNSK